MDLRLEHLLCRGPKGVQFVQVGEGKALIAAFNYPGGCKTKPHSSQKCIAEGQGALVTQREILTRYRERK